MANRLFRLANNTTAKANERPRQIHLTIPVNLLHPDTIHSVREKVSDLFSHGGVSVSIVATSSHSYELNSSSGEGSGARQRSLEAALQARPLELDMRCGVRGGNRALVTGLDEGVQAKPELDKMSWSTSAHWYLSQCPHFG